MWDVLEAANAALAAQPLELHLSFLPALLGIGGALGSLFGGIGKGRAEGRAQEADLLTRRDAVEANKYGTAQGAQMQAGNLDLARKGFTEDARGGRAKQALIGDLLSRIQDANVSVPGIQSASVSGGIRPSALGSLGRESAGELARQALMAQMTPDQFQGGQILQPPRASPLPQSSGLDSFLNIGALLGTGMGALGGSGVFDQAQQGPDLYGRTQQGIGNIAQQLPGGLDPRLLDILGQG